jgi:hypothetical protein
MRTYFDKACLLQTKSASLNFNKSDILRMSEFSLINYKYTALAYNRTENVNCLDRFGSGREKISSSFPNTNSNTARLRPIFIHFSWHLCTAQGSHAYGSSLLQSFLLIQEFRMSDPCEIFGKISRRIRMHTKKE